MSNKDKDIKSFLKPRTGKRIRQGYFTPKNPASYPSAISIKIQSVKINKIK